MREHPRSLSDLGFQRLAGPRGIRSLVASRSKLMSLLSEACELEHALSCAYLYAAFSIKDELSEGGLGWEQLSLLRSWRGAIFKIAAEEMLHMAQAWNLLIAVGGHPYTYRPPFPQQRGYYSMGADLALDGLSERTLERFIAFERPSDPDESPAGGFSSVGDLYRAIAALICELDDRSELFVGRAGPTAQTTHFPDLVSVTDRDSALEAIETIVDQGEGRPPTDIEDSHYDTFNKLLEEFRSQRAADRFFEPARPVISNPSVRHAVPGTTLISDPTAASCARLFDATYVLMLRLLGYAFTAEASVRDAMGHLSIDLMTAAIKPIAESLMLMNAGGSTGLHAGPPFALTRGVHLPTVPSVALTVVGERLDELCEWAERLSHEAAPSSRLTRAVVGLELSRERFHTATRELRQAKVRR